MGDRTECRLEISGILAEDDIDRLVETIQQFDPFEGEDHIRQSLRDEEPEFTFEEVNYASLDTSLSGELKALNLSFRWVWDSGDEYGPGVTLYDALTGEEASFSTVDRDIAITLNEIDTDGRIDEIRRWDKILNGPFPFVVYRSNHHLLDLKAQGELPEGYLELHHTEAA